MSRWEKQRQHGHSCQLCGSHRNPRKGGSPRPAPLPHPISISDCLGPHGPAYLQGTQAEAGNSQQDSDCTCLGAGKGELTVDGHMGHQALADSSLQDAALLEQHCTALLQCIKSHSDNGSSIKFTFIALRCCSSQHDNIYI